MWAGGERAGRRRVGREAGLAGQGEGTEEGWGRSGQDRQRGRAERRRGGGGGGGGRELGAGRSGSEQDGGLEAGGEAGQGDGAGRRGRDDADTEVRQGGGAGERGGGSRAGRRGGGVGAGDAVVEFVARLSGWFTSQETRGPIGGLRSDTDGIFTARSHIWPSSATSRPVVFSGYPRLCQSPGAARPWVTTGPEGLVVERRAHRQVGGSETVPLPAAPCQSSRQRLWATLRRRRPRSARSIPEAIISQNP